MTVHVQTDHRLKKLVSGIHIPYGTLKLIPVVITFYFYLTCFYFIYISLIYVELKCLQKRKQNGWTRIPTQIQRRFRCFTSKLSWAISWLEKFTNNKPCWEHRRLESPRHTMAGNAMNNLIFHRYTEYNKSTHKLTSECQHYNILGTLVYMVNQWDFNYSLFFQKLCGVQLLTHDILQHDMLVWNRRCLISARVSQW